MSAETPQKPPSNEWLKRYLGKPLETRVRLSSPIETMIKTLVVHPEIQSKIRAGQAVEALFIGVSPEANLVLALARELESQESKLEALVIDRNQATINKAEGHLPQGVKIVRGSFPDNKLVEEGAYDVVVAENLIYLIGKEEFPTFLKGVKKALQPGGIFIASAPIITGPFRLLRGPRGAIREANTRLASEKVGHQQIETEKGVVFLINANEIPD